MPASSITGLPELSQASLSAKDVIAVVSLGAAETKKITAENYVLGTISKLPDGSIDGSKIDLSTITIEVGTDDIEDGSVTAEKLGDESTWIVDPTTPAAGEFVGQALLNTTTGYAYVWNGAAWVGYKAANSVNSVVADVIPNNILLATAQADDEVRIIAAYGVTNQPRAFVAGPTGNGGDIEQRQIVSGDLPVATDVDPGVIAPGLGLTVDDTGSLTIDNDVPEQTARSVVTYNSKGLVTSGGPIEPADLPIATDTTPGVVMPGPDLTVDGSGELIISNQVSPGPGTYVKVQVKENGLVEQGFTTLDVSDLPDLSYDQITSGEIGPGVLGECAVEAPNICDYATCLMQEDNPGAGDYLGQFWYTPSTAQLRVYARGSGPENIWLPVGFGALQANNLRWGGTYDADSDTLVSLTSIGVSEGLTAGQPFPASTDQLSGIYFICQVAGNNCTQPNLNGINHTAGDWALCLDQAQGWVHIDANAGGSGGGGGGAQYLNDLLDVEIGGASSPFSTAPAVTLSADQLLRYDGGAGLWRNTDIIDGGSID